MQESVSERQRESLCVCVCEREGTSDHAKSSLSVSLSPSLCRFELCVCLNESLGPIRFLDVTFAPLPTYNTWRIVMLRHVLRVCTRERGKRHIQVTYCSPRQKPHSHEWTTSCDKSTHRDQWLKRSNLTHTSGVANFHVTELQPIANKVAQNLEITSKKIQAHQDSLGICD